MDEAVVWSGVCGERGKQGKGGGGEGGDGCLVEEGINGSLRSFIDRRIEITTWL